MIVFSRTLSLGALLCIAMMATVVRAQNGHTMPAPPASDAPPASTTASPDATGKKDGADKMVKRMSTVLSLTEDQKQQVKSLADDRQTQLDNMNADTSLSADAKKQKRQGIQADFDKKVKAILTDDQKAQYDKMKQDQQDKRKGGGASPSDAASTTAAPDSQ
jgi:periplasmic protein CpxP/Spy